MNFQYDIPSIPTDNSRPLCTSVWFDFNAGCYWKLSIPRTSWRTSEAGAKLYFSSRTHYSTHCIGRTNVFGCSWQVWCCWKKYLKWIMFLRQIINRIPLLKYRYRVSSPSDYVPTLDNDTFAIINTQPSNMRGEHWIMIANSRQILYFVDSLGRKKHSFLKQQFEQMMPEPLQSHTSLCGSYTIYAAFHLFKFRQEEITGVHDVNVLSFKCNYMYYFFFSKVNVQVIQCVC